MIQKLLVLAATVFTFSAQASFSDLDIAVRESVELYSLQAGLGLDMGTLLYKGPESLTVKENTAIVTSYVQDASAVTYVCVTRVALPNMDEAYSICEATQD